ncbi:MAG: MFS transporter [Pseudomonadota bacterium]
MIDGNYSVKHFITSSSVRRLLIFVIACLLFLLSQFYRASVAVITPDLIRDLSMDSAGLSLISAAFFYAFALMQIPISMYLDGIGPRVSMTVLSLIAVMGAVMFALGHSLSVLVTGRVLIGIGMACNLMGTLKLITLWYTPRHFGTLSTMVFSLGTVGNLVAATPLVLMVQAMGWRNSFLMIAGINLVLTLLFYLIARDRPESSTLREIPKPASTRIREIRGNLGSLFREKDYWIISLGTFCRYGIYAAVLSLWAAPFLINVMGISVLSAGNLLFLMSIGMAAGSPVFGWLSDVVLKNRKQVIVFGLVAMGADLSLLTRLSSDAGMTVLCILFFGFGFFASSGGLMYAHIKERMPVELAGTAMTGINFFTMIGVAIFLQGLGNMMQFFHPGESLGAAAFTDAFLFCAACLLVTAVIYSFTVETLGGKRF